MGWTLSVFCSCARNGIEIVIKHLDIILHAACLVETE